MGYSPSAARFLPFVVPSHLLCTLDRIGHGGPWGLIPGLTLLQPYLAWVLHCTGEIKGGGNTFIFGLTDVDR